MYNDSKYYCLHDTINICFELWINRDFLQCIRCLLYFIWFDFDVFLSCSFSLFTQSSVWSVFPHIKQSQWYFCSVGNERFWYLECHIFSWFFYLSLFFMPMKQYSFEFSPWWVAVFTLLWSFLYSRFVFFRRCFFRCVEMSMHMHEMCIAYCGNVQFEWNLIYFHWLICIFFFFGNDESEFSVFFLVFLGHLKIIYSN